MSKDVTPTMGEDLGHVASKTSKATVPIQLTWDNISITAHPPTGKCKGRGALKEPKLIIDGCSGTVLPGQFLAIIGASGK